VISSNTSTTRVVQETVKTYIKNIRAKIIKTKKETTKWNLPHNITKLVYNDNLRRIYGGRWITKITKQYYHGNVTESSGNV